MIACFRLREAPGHRVRAHRREGRFRQGFECFQIFTGDRNVEVDAPQPGSVWTFEVVRFRYAGGPKEKEYSSWNVGSTHRNPASFGNIVFSGTTSDMERLLVDRIKPVAGGDISIYAAHGEIRYTDYETLKSRRAAEMSK